MLRAGTCRTRRLEGSRSRQEREKRAGGSNASARGEEKTWMEDWQLTEVGWKHARDGRVQGTNAGLRGDTGRRRA